MKKTLLTIMEGAGRWAGCALAAGWLAGTAAEAQQYGQAPVTQGGAALTNAVPLSSTNATPSDPIGLTKYGDVTLVLQYNLAASDASGGGMWFRFAESADGTNFSSTPPASLVFLLPSNSTNTVTLVTNVAVGSTGYLELLSMGNSATNTATNITVQAWVKPKRNG